MKKLFLLLGIGSFLLCLVHSATALPLINGNFDETSYSSPYLGKINHIALEAMEEGQWDVYDSIDGWEAGANDAGIEIQYNTVVQSHSPNFYVELDSHGGQYTNSSMTQEVYLDSGIYDLSFWYRARTETAGDNGISFSLGNFSGSVDGVKSDFTDWTEYIYSITIDFEGLYNLTFAATGIDNSLGGFIDDVKLAQGSTSSEPVPEPATFILLSLGLAGFAGTRKKKVS